MSLEFRFCISPTPGFYSNIRLAALSLRKLGPPYDSARLIVAVGDYATLDEIQAATPWSRDLPIIWRTVPQDQFTAESYRATHNERFLEPLAANTQAVFICDADACLVDRIDALVELLSGPGRRVAGLQAHFSPFSRDPAVNETEWRRIYAAFPFGPPSFEHPYSGDPQAVCGWAPPYVNYGFVGLSREAFEAVAPVQAEVTRKVADLTNNLIFQGQIALSLILNATDIRYIPLSFAYNCSNDDLPFTAAAPYRIDDAAEARVIHYLRGEQLDRHKFLVETAAYRSLLGAHDLNPVNFRLRAHVLNLSKTK